MALDIATWYATPSGDGTDLSFAGMWYGYVSLPIFQFLLVRWYFRLFVWTRFLWQVSRIRLQVVPTHPDGVGGLGFLSNTVYAFAVLAVAHGALLAGPLANRIFFAGAALPQFKVEIAVVVAFMLCVVLGPLLLFAPLLAQAKRLGLREYGTLSQRYVREFDAKWLRGGAPRRRAFRGQRGRPVARGPRRTVSKWCGPCASCRSRDRQSSALAVATLAPLVPLMLTMMPLEDLLKKLFALLV